MLLENVKLTSRPQGPVVVIIVSFQYNIETYLLKFKLNINTNHHQDQFCMSVAVWLYYQNWNDIYVKTN